jgi:hypothetical protein
LGFTELDQDLQRRTRFGLVDPAHRKPDVNQDPIADATLDRVLRVDDAGEVNLTLNSTHDGSSELACHVVDPDDLAGDSETHQLPSFFERRAIH